MYVCVHAIKKDDIYKINIISAYWIQVPAFAQRRGVKISGMQLKATSIERGRSIGRQKVLIPSRRLRRANAGFAKTAINGNDSGREAFPFAVVRRKWKLVTSMHRYLYLRTLNSFAQVMSFVIASSHSSFDASVSYLNEYKNDTTIKSYPDNENSCKEGLKQINLIH